MQLHLLRLAPAMIPPQRNHLRWHISYTLVKMATCALFPSSGAAHLSGTQAATPTMQVCGRLLWLAKRLLSWTQPSWPLHAAVHCTPVSAAPSPPRRLLSVYDGPSVIRLTPDGARQVFATSYNGNALVTPVGEHERHIWRVAMRSVRYVFMHCWWAHHRCIWRRPSCNSAHANTPP